MLNNYPLHAFDDFEARTLQYRGNEYETFQVAVPPRNMPGLVRPVVTDHILGFRLFKGLSGLMSEIDERRLLVCDSIAKVKKKNFPYKNAQPHPLERDQILRMAGSLFSTLFYPAEDGQIRFPEEAARTYLVDTGDIDMLDFSSPNLDLARGKEHMSRHKNDLINNVKDELLRGQSATE